MSKIYLIVPFENKDDAKNLGAKFDWDKNYGMLIIQIKINCLKNIKNINHLII
jgi:hypothetical protein